MAQDPVGVDTQALSLIEIEVIQKNDEEIITSIQDVTFWLAMNRVNSSYTQEFGRVHAAKREFLKLLQIERSVRGI